MIRQLILLILCVFSTSLFSKEMHFVNERERTQYVTLTKEIRCVVCQNQSIAESNAPLAKDLRRKVYEQLLAGKNPGEIKQFLVKRYGDSVLFSPPTNKRTLFFMDLPLRNANKYFWLFDYLEMNVSNHAFFF